MSCSGAPVQCSLDDPFFLSAFIDNRIRQTSDTLDLNRVFPGDRGGSHTERLAAALTTHAIDGAEIVIDLHGGGSWCVNAFVFQFPGGEALSGPGVHGIR